MPKLCSRFSRCARDSLLRATVDLHSGATLLHCVYSLQGQTSKHLWVDPGVTVVQCPEITQSKELSKDLRVDSGVTQGSRICGWTLAFTHGSRIYASQQITRRRPSQMGMSTHKSMHHGGEHLTAQAVRCTTGLWVQHGATHEYLIKSLLWDQ